MAGQAAQLFVVDLLQPAETDDVAELNCAVAGGNDLGGGLAGDPQDAAREGRRGGQGQSVGEGRRPRDLFDRRWYGALAQRDGQHECLRPGRRHELRVRLGLDADQPRQGPGGRVGLARFDAGLVDAHPVDVPVFDDRRARGVQNRAPLRRGAFVVQPRVGVQVGVDDGRGPLEAPLLADLAQHGGAGELEIGLREDVTLHQLDVGGLLAVVADLADVHLGQQARHGAHRLLVVGLGSFGIAGQRQPADRACRQRVGQLRRQLADTVWRGGRERRPGVVGAAGDGQQECQHGRQSTPCDGA